MVGRVEKRLFSLGSRAPSQMSGVARSDDGKQRYRGRSWRRAKHRDWRTRGEHLSTQVAANIRLPASMISIAPNGS